VTLSFGIQKCASASVIRGKLAESTNITLSEEVFIPILGVFNSYKYLGLLEHDTIKDSQIKSMVIMKYRQRTRKVLKSSLNGKNIITTINTWAIPLMRYTAKIVCWTQNELKTLDISTRKLMALHKCFNFNDDVHRLYVPRELGGRGLLSVEDVRKTSTWRIFGVFY